jgi:hypothetical protein
LDNYVQIVDGVDHPRRQLFERLVNELFELFAAHGHDA